MKKKVYIVTGGTGFMGNNLVKELESRAEDVVVLIRSKEKFRQALAGARVSAVYGGILCPADLDKLFCEAAALYGGARCDGNPGKPPPYGRPPSAGVEYVLIHTASIVYLGNDRKKHKEMYETNVDGTKNVIEACLRHNARLVYVSSVEAIAAPKKGVIYETDAFDPKKVIGRYAKTKAEASRLVLDAVRNRGLDAVIVHPAGIVGPNDFSDTHTTQIALDYKAGNIPASTSGGYNFVDVRDVVSGTVAAAQKGKSGDCYILSNRFYSVSEMMDTLHGLGAGEKIKKKFPLWVAKFGLPFMTLWDKLRGKTTLYSRYALTMLGLNSNFSHEKASRELGFEPRGLKESFKDVLDGLPKSPIFSNTIFCYSGTGNTYASAKRIAERLDMQVVFITAELIASKPVVEGEIGIIMAPPYAYGLPVTVKKFIQASKFNVQYMAVLATPGSTPGGMLAEAIRLLRRRKQKVSYSMGIKSVENFVQMFKLPSEEGIVLANIKQYERTDAVIQDIKNRKRKRRILFRPDSSFVSFLFRRIASTFAKRYRFTDECNGCGICARVCPAHAITIHEGQKPRVNPKKCDHCEGCTMLCPQKAITFGKITPESRRYRHPDVTVSQLTKRE